MGGRLGATFLGIFNEAFLGGGGGKDFFVWAWWGVFGFFFLNFWAFFLWGYRFGLVGGGRGRIRAGGRERILWR